MTIRLVTWNINSVRLRSNLIAKLSQNYQPDIICLQETKCPDDKFPFDELHACGYEYIHISGMKSYNGVAILSKIPFLETNIYARVGREDCRHISVKLDALGGAELHNLYIPAGGDEPDPTVNEKFQHKLNFVDEMTDWFADKYTDNAPVIAVGDLNIAPQEHDVWSHKQLLKIISHTPIEVEKLTNMQHSLNWIDSAREFVSSDEKLYSWWSYRNRDWKKSNRGRRLDHVWVTPALKDKLSAHDTLSEARDWEKPSDHVPVIIDFKN